MPNRKLVNIRLSPKLWQTVKLRAYAQGMTLTAWVIDAIRQKLARDKGHVPNSGDVAGANSGIDRNSKKSADSLKSAKSKRSKNNENTSQTIC